MNTFRKLQSKNNVKVEFRTYQEYFRILKKECTSWNIRGIEKSFVYFKIELLRQERYMTLLNMSQLLMNL